MEQKFKRKRLKFLFSDNIVGSLDFLRQTFVRNWKVREL